MTDPNSPTSRALSQQEIDARVKPILDELLRYHDDDLRPFRRADWVMILIAKELIATDDDILQALNQTISEVPPAIAYAATVETTTLRYVAEFAKTELPRSEGDKLLTFKTPEIFSVRLLDYALFDDSHRWAVVSHHMDFSMIGGDAEFMAAFLGRIEGGLDALKRRFVEYADHWYPSVEFRKKVLAGVGWQDLWQPKE